jgi:rubrerythrin
VDVYSYECLDCQFTWTSSIPEEKCPKCGSILLDLWDFD